MASSELRALWKLNQIDSSLVDIRKRAAALDPGRKLMADLEVVEKEYAEVGGAAKALTGELADLELAQQGAADKIKKIEKDLYSGKVVNPREVEAYQKDIEALKRQRAKHDDRIMELLELAPPAKAAAAAVEAKVAKVKAELSAHRKAAMELKTKLEEEFKRLNAARPEAAKGIDAGLLARYDAIRAKQGTGMADIKKGSSCAGCGNLLPARTLEALKVDRTVTCEQCHRILYYTEGLI